MNRFPYRKKRKGTRPNDQQQGKEAFEAEKVGKSETAVENFGNHKRKRGYGKPQSHSKNKADFKRNEIGDGTAHVGGSPRPDANRAARKNVARRSNKNKQYQTAGEISGGGPAFSSQGRTHKGKGKRAQTGEQFLRNLRAPVKPTPSATYDPKKAQKSKTSSKKDVSKRRHASGLYAALDLGTNNCRLLVAVPQERGRFRVVDGYSKIVRLGEGLGYSGRLKDDAMERAIGALKICAEKLSNRDIKRFRLIATEACRQAENGEAFLDRVKKETGLELEIINRQTEASLAAEGCGALIDKKADAGVLFDIGGGSSELMLVNRKLGPKRISEQIVSWHSLPVGVVTLSERFGGKAVDRENFKAMVDEVLQLLEQFEGRDSLAKIWNKGRVHLLGTSGTVTTLAGIHLELPRYDRRQVDGLWLQDSEIDHVLESLLDMDYEQRSQSPCIGKERADLVMAGCAILEAIRITWPSKRLRVADRGLREGILTQMMDSDGAWIKRRKKRWSKKRLGRAIA